ncbi:fibronectin type III domain-containing protein [Timonella sp. A28]|uniref:fibronectin type III domain-containing protein n=1 Tax=Timonella sp. A28 TaxID=3442640 RepID=UPI003EBCAEE1
MAIKWGSWQGPTYERFRVGIDLWVSGTTINAGYWLETSGSVSDNQKLTLTGAITGEVSFTASQPSGGGTQKIAQKSRSGTRGSSYSFGAKLSGVYNGVTPSVSDSITVPATVPSKPGTPTFSGITSDDVTINWSFPNGNGATPTAMQIQVSTNSGFTALVKDYEDGSPPSHPQNLAANTSHYVRIRAKNSAGWSSWSNTASFTTKPVSPSAQTGLGVTRVSDSQQTLSWTRNSTSAAPYTSQQVERRDTHNLSWVRIATVTATATSYSDTTTVSSRRYDYRVRAVNSAGSSAYSAATAVSTKPSAPNTVTAKKSGSSIVISWKHTTSQWGVFQNIIQDNPGGTGWVTVATVGAVTSWTHSNPDTSKTHQYRVLTRVYTYGVNASYYVPSDYSAASAVVQLLAPPLAPTRVKPTGTLDRDLPVTFEWTHNPVDTTDQTAYELQYRVAGSNWITTTGSSESTWTLPAPGVTGSIEWQVRTRGDYASFGPWSSLGSVLIVSRPTVVIASPINASVLGESVLTVEWAYANADSYSQSQWEVNLLQEGSLIEVRTGSSAIPYTTFQTPLSDQATYGLTVRVRSAAGLWSEQDSASFTTDFPLPVVVEPIPEWDMDTGAVSLTFADPPIPGTGEVLPETLDIQRQIGDGPWITIATDIPPDGALTDPIPSLLDINRYRAISKTSLPSSNTGQPVEIVWVPPILGTPIFINGGDGFGLTCHVHGHSADETSTVATELHHVAGNPYPVAYWGTEENHRIGFSGNLLYGASTREEWLALARSRSIVCYRDRRGRREFGVLTVALSDNGLVISVSGAVQKTMWEEGS